MLLLLAPLVFVDCFFFLNNINDLEVINRRISGGLTAFNGCLNDGGRLLVNFQTPQCVHQHTLAHVTCRLRFRSKTHEFTGPEALGVRRVSALVVGCPEVGILGVGSERFCCVFAGASAARAQGFCNPGPAAQQSATDATGAQRPQRVLGCVLTLLTRVLTPHARAIPPVRPPLQFLTLSHTTVTTLQPHHLTILRVFITAAAA